MAKERTLPYIDFLRSETISLKADGSEQKFQIHRKLLGVRCKNIISAFEREFDEKQKGTYTFQDTSAGTLARFIEWAYTDDYPAIINATYGIERKPNEAEDTKTVVKDENVATPTATDLTSENHPLLAHIRLYIFCNIYHIPDLQQLAFEKLTACFIDLEKPKSLDTQLAVVDALRVSFSRLPPQDPLLDWLAEYAAYCVDKLRLQKEFLDVLKASPTLSSRVILWLNPASSPPWRTQKPKHSYSHYTPGDDYDDYD